MRNIGRITFTISFLFCLVAQVQAAFLPTPEKLMLKNGMTVFYLHSTDTPIVSVRMWLPGAGSIQEPADKEGVANLTALLMQKGTSRANAETIAEELDFMGADLSISAGDEYASVAGESLAEHFPQLLGITADCLAHPSFPEEEFQKEKKKHIDNLKTIRDNPAAAVRCYFQKAYFGSHPLGHLSSGVESSLQQMTIEDVRQFYASYFRPNQALAAVVGDISREQLTALLDKTLGAWTCAEPASAKMRNTGIPPLPKPKGMKLVLVDKPDATQAYWRLGSPGYAMGDPITSPATVLNTLFGGRFTSWLNTELRIKRGLTYGANSNFQTWSMGGLFGAGSYTKNDKIGEMLDIVFDLLKKVRKEGFSAEEIESARNYIQGQFPPTLESNANKAASYVRLAFYRLGFDYYDRHLEAVRKATPAETKEAAVRLVPETDLVLTVVGKASDIRRQLEKYGTWTEKKITDPDF